MGSPDCAELIALLERAAHREPRSGREALAQTRALRLLERLTRSDVPAMPEGWHPRGHFEELDRADSPELRERWWRALHD
jgi:hypothetical protein